MNDGVIATDGALDLTLGGRYEGNGALSSLGDLTFKAASADFGSEAQVRSGGIGRFELSGQLLNQGRLTAAQDLSLKLGSLDNRGTLGGSGLLRIEGDSLHNEQGLIFSGADMTLRTVKLVNLLGDIYSLGELDVARDEKSGALDLLDNRSASIESLGDMSLSAAKLNNVRDVLTLSGNEKFSISIVELPCGNYGLCDYRGEGRRNAIWQITEKDRLRVIESSAASRLLSGGDLDFSGEVLNNESSTIAAAGSISGRFDVLNNKGVMPAQIDTVRTYWSWVNEFGQASRWAQHINSTHVPTPQAGLESDLSQFISWLWGGQITAPSQTRKELDGSAYSAIIQAGGSIDIQASKNLENSVEQASYIYVAGGQKVGDTGVGSSFSTPINLSPQLPADTAQQAVDPISLPGFSLPQGQNGLFQTNSDPGHRYLIETNPAFADLKQFISSDYMLGLLGFDTDAAQKRLGDGLYEQRLIRDAVVARTGKRLLDGLASDEAQFKYLMDNAIASKESLKLVPGISLSAEQVAALTHDIVWMEEREVQGEKVLVPVLYLAQAKDRLAPGGSLIQGRNVALISGSNLHNSGTLRATQNLTATASDITNSGLMQANERLQLLATGSIRNAQGGVINGKDVTLTAGKDVINERSVTVHRSQTERSDRQQSFVDDAARIEAGSGLSITAGNDLQNIGGALKSGADTRLNAGRDLLLVSAEAENRTHTWDRKGYGKSSSLTQYGSEVDVGGNLTATAGRDIAVVASHVKATGDVALTAQRDVSISAAANETHSESFRKSGGKKVQAEDSQVRQQASVVEAGGDLNVKAGGNLVVAASQLKAGDEAYLYAGEQLALLAAQDSDYHLFDKKNKGSFGAKETRRDEVTDVRNVGTQITSGGNLTLASEGDQLYQRARLESGGNLTLDSGGAITFEAVKDLHQESHEKSKSDLAWNSMKGKGSTDETLLQSQLIAQGEIVIKAADGLKIDIKQIDQKTVSQTIDAMVAADPQLAWIKAAEQRGDVDWRQVKEIHDSFKYSHSGLGVGAQLAIAVFIAAVVGPMAIEALGTVGGSAATSLATTGTISTVNNKGNLGAALKETFSGDSLKNAAVAGVTAGLTESFYDGVLKTKTNPVTGKVTVDLSSLEGIGRFAGNQALQGGTSAVLNKALGRDVDFKDALQTALFNTIAAAAFNAVGDHTKDVLADGSPGKVAIHALVGGLLSEATGGDFASGALAAGANEALIEDLNALVKGNETLLQMASQLVGILAAGITNGDPENTAWVTKNATQYNYLLHEENAREAIEEAKERCKSDPLCPKTVDTDVALQALRIIGGKDISAARTLDKDAVAFAGYMLRRDKDLRYEIYLPESLKENVVDNLPLVIDLAFPDASGKAKVAAKVTNKIGKEAAEALEKKFGESLAKDTAGSAGKVGPKATEPLKALPAPRQIDASWSSNTYKHGGLMTGIEHVFYRHGPDSGFSNTSKFAAGTSLKDISKYVDSALRYGKVTPNGPGGYVVEYNVGKIIGVDVSGKATSTLKVNVRDGIINTAFPN
ncbi:DUF637 domain-containing protein [Metapseudomonas otitidis]